MTYEAHTSDGLAICWIGGLLLPGRGVCSIVWNVAIPARIAARMMTTVLQDGSFVSREVRL